jgi:glycosyltransferase involved in cell wall biosynthesis
VVVGNTPDELPHPEADAGLPADVRDWAGRPLVVFLGNLLSDRGLTQAIAAVGKARAAVPDIGFLIIGDGPEHAKLDAQIEHGELRGHVRLLGWRSYTEHSAYYRAARVGVLPFLATDHINITLANKLFDYMASSLAIVASDVPPMRRVIEETGAGVLVPPGDVDALADAFVRLLLDPARCRELGERGRRAVEGRYNWAADRARFLAAVARAGADS